MPGETPLTDILDWIPSPDGLEPSDEAPWLSERPSVPGEKAIEVRAALPFSHPSYAEFLLLFRQFTECILAALPLIDETGKADAEVPSDFIAVVESNVARAASALETYMSGEGGGEGRWRPIDSSLEYYSDNQMCAIVQTIGFVYRILRFWGWDGRWDRERPIPRATLGIRSTDLKALAWGLTHLPDLKSSYKQPKSIIINGYWREGNSSRVTVPVVLGKSHKVPPLVFGMEKPCLSPSGFKLIRFLIQYELRDLTLRKLKRLSRVEDAHGILDRLRNDKHWRAVIHFPGDDGLGGYWIKRSLQI